MTELLSKVRWRDLLLFLVDACGAEAKRAQRRARILELVLRMRHAAFLFIDHIAPARRRALRERQRVRAMLAHIPRNAPSMPSLYEAGGSRADAVRIDGLKLGIIIPSFLRGQGGAEKVAGQLADAAARGGAEVTLLCRRPDEGQQPYLLDSAVRIVLVDVLDDADVRALGQRPFDLLVCFGMAHFYRRIPHVAKLLDVPFVIQECTNPGLLTRQLLRLTDARSLAEAISLREAVLAHAHGVRLTSPLYQADLPSTVRPFSYAFYNAFRVPDVEPQTFCATHRRKLICVGALKNANKNGLAALIGFCAFATRHSDWQLVFYGENNFRAEFEELLRRHPDADVRDAGIVRDVAEIYGGAYALLIPSFDEGLPNVVVEAFSFGVPCIGFSDCAAVAHLVRPGFTGLLVDRTDPAGIEQTLELLADSSLRDRLAQGAHAFAVENFGFDKWVRNWLRLLHNTTDGRDRNGSVRAPAAHDELSADAVAWRTLLTTFRAIA